MGAMIQGWVQAYDSGVPLWMAFTELGTMAVVLLLIIVLAVVLGK